MQGPTGNDLSSVSYTSQALVERKLPTGAIITGSTPASSKILQSVLLDIIARWSRRIDAELWDLGFQTPFPDVAASAPAPPHRVVELVTEYVAAECREILAQGNRMAGAAKAWRSDADALLAEIKARPNALGYVRVTTPEDFTVQVGSGTSPSYREAGLMQGVWYRLKNRNVDRHSVRFVRSDGSEAVSGRGTGFLPRIDWEMISPAEGTFAIYNNEILSAVAALGATGGVVYEYGWRRLDWGQTGQNPLQGVSRL